MSIFSERIKWLRERKSLTQKEMAEKLDISRSNYSKYEYGQREPTIETLAKLPGILGESVDFIIGVTDFTNNAGKIYGSFEEASSVASVVKTEKERTLWIERMEMSRDLLLNLLNETPFVKESTLSHIRESDGWLFEKGKSKDPS